ncbi:FG-GAP repeat domain-containing protein [Glycomyces tritici]|uniref:VCBS repeat-containing protein n=1 Tax=Glycomyces tritici TaxID=2665176 RepID=A0ABT7YQ72_9ACTN|nr:VCBS repeat-containing protein [Glycomyces tritici]MDN3240752.1 VCBS repeat-containing protein [Glycomyces tritici]
MNEAPPEKPRRRRPARIAAATAAALGATLLAYPGGTATAQTDINCDALGDNPVEPHARDAVETAIACGVDVRISSRNDPHTTIAATPDGEFHLVATVEPSQQVPVDTTLEVAGDSLVSAEPIWGARLPHAADANFLLWTGLSKLTWAGGVPTPEYSGSTAVYDELATGLDLTAELGANSAEFRFTVDDEAAWNALSTGLGTGLGMDSGDEQYAVVDGTLRLEPSSSTYSEYGSEWSTPFTIRDAEGTVATAGLALEADGSLRLSSPDAEPAYPLTLSTQWAERAFWLNEWGSVTSAAPDTAVYRGRAGLDDAYFASAGADSLVGAYCDTVADPSCTTQFEAEAYWGFQWPMLEHVFNDHWEELSFPVSSASFTVDAAEGATCTAPELQLTGEYTPAATWNARPEAIGAAGVGACRDGTAEYDVTAALHDTWGDSYGGTDATFAMTDSSPAALFDGGSARLDVYFAAVVFRYDPPTSTCSTTQASPVQQGSSTPRYGGFYTQVMHQEVFVPDLTWTATFADSETGATILTTAPAALGPEFRPTWRLGAADALADGNYEVTYEFTSVEGEFAYTSETCYFAVDTAAPDLVSIEVESGLHQVGDEVEVTVEVADAGYPGSGKSLLVQCWSSGCEVPGTTDTDSVRLTTGTTASFSVTLHSSAAEVPIAVLDEANNQTVESVWIHGTGNHHDFNGDGSQDLMAVRASDGALVFHAGGGDGTFAPGVSKGTGWGGFDVTMAGDLTGDGKPDLLARDAKTGTLYTYPGDGSGGVGPRITVGTGWNALGAFTSAGDFNSDGKLDLYAVGRSDGRLHFYPGQGGGTFGTRVLLGTGWGVMDALTAAGDLNEDGKADLLAHDSRTGQYYLYQGDGAGRLSGRIAVAASLDGSGTDRYSQVTGVGDQDGDGREDLLAVDSRTGELELHSLNGNGTAVHAGKVVATGWGGNRLAVVDEERTYDYNGDGATDFVARVGVDGTTYLYPGTGTGTHGTRVSWGTALQGMTLIATAGDLNGDGFADVLARTSGGTLYLYPGTGSGALDTAGRITVGTGWNAMGAITGGHDYNADGKTDVIAVASDGALWLYPGTGNGTFGARKAIGSGWTSMKEITATGDLDHDGHADALAVRSSDGCLFFYGGTGTGLFKTAVKVGCGWNAMDAVTGIGDFDRDGHVDWMARRKSDGSLFLYPGDGAGNHSAAKLVGTGWNAMTIA